MNTAMLTAWLMILDADGYVITERGVPSTFARDARWCEQTEADRRFEAKLSIHTGWQLGGRFT